jgi:uncharacterized membrane protein
MDNESDGTNLIQGIIELLPVLSIAVMMSGAWLNMQSQITDLRARYEATTDSTRQSLADMKGDIQENSELLRQLLRETHNNHARPTKGN